MNHPTYGAGAVYESPMTYSGTAVGSAPGATVSGAGSPGAHLVATPSASGATSTLAPGAHVSAVPSAHSPRPGAGSVTYPGGL